MRPLSRLGGVQSQEGDMSMQGKQPDRNASSARRAWLVDEGGPEVEQVGQGYKNLDKAAEARQPVQGSKARWWGLAGGASLLGPCPAQMMLEVIRGRGGKDISRQG